ncbi:lipopolysaccharide biosynthesis protein [Pseudomonas helleri]|uniref:lipopolysaccharide biosynthesis protein n=1 Tax=Pseudomonas helleri TaxID=1608996 RepID=UPI003FD5D4A8
MKFNNRTINRFARGLGANGLMQISQLLMRLAEIPLLLSFWGAQGYGEWLMITALPTALALSDGGVTKTAQRKMTMQIAANDVTGAIKTYQSTWALLLIISMILITSITAILSILPLAEFIKFTTIDNNSLLYTVFLLTLQIAITFQCGLMRGVFTCRGNYATGELYQVLIYILSFTGMVIAILLGGNITSAATGMLIGTALGACAMWKSLKTKEKTIHHGFKYVSIAEIKELFIPSISNLSFPLGDTINIQGSRILIGITLGPAAVAAFSSLRTLCRVALQPLLAISRTIEPEMASAYGAGKDSSVNELLLRGSQAIFWISLIACGGLALIGPKIFAIWTHDNLVFNWPVFLLLTAASFIGAFWSVGIMVPCATNRHMRISKYYLLIQILGCGSLLYLTPTFGEKGAALGLLLVEILICIVVMIVTSRMTGLSITTWMKKTATPTISDFTKLIK